MERYYAITESEFKSILDDLEDKYYNGDEKNEAVSDKEFDELKDIYESRFGKYKRGGFLSEGGGCEGEVSRGDRVIVLLDFYMGSLDKCKNISDINAFVKRNSLQAPFLLDDKVDGVSCQLIYSNRKLKLRKKQPNGTSGTDITYLAKYLNLPDLSKLKETIKVRLELVVKKSDFEDYKDIYTNPRVMVASLTNSKHFKPEDISKISCIAYQLVTDDKLQLKKSQQLLKLKKLGFTVPEYKIVNNLREDELEALFQSRQSEADYECDGIVVTSDHPYVLNNDSDPTFAFAFKGKTESEITTVTHIEWNASKDGLLKPIVHFKNVFLSGANLCKATGHNAKYILDNKIGKDTEIEVIRSGGVIAYIQRVVTSTSAELPDEEYEWRGVDIVLSNRDDRVEKSAINYFFTTLDIKGVSDKTVDKLYENGFDSIKRIIQASQEDISKIDRMGKTSAENIKTAINKRLSECEMEELMCASGCFGRGLAVKKLRKLLSVYPDFLEWETVDLDRIKKCGIVKLGPLVKQGLPVFKQWLRDIPEIGELREPQVENDEDQDDKSEDEEVFVIENKRSSNKNLANEKIVFTGFRDKDLEREIRERGGEVVTSISKKVTVLLVKELGKLSGKELKAEEMGIKIMTREQFRNKFG